MFRNETILLARHNSLQLLHASQPARRRKRKLVTRRRRCHKIENFQRWLLKLCWLAPRRIVEICKSTLGRERTTERTFRLKVRSLWQMHCKFAVAIYSKQVWSFVFDLGWVLPGSLGYAEPRLPVVSTLITVKLKSSELCTTLRLLEAMLFFRCCRLVRNCVHAVTIGPARPGPALVTKGFFNFFFVFFGRDQEPFVFCWRVKTSLSVSDFSAWLLLLLLFCNCFTLWIDS